MAFRHTFACFTCIWTLALIMAIPYAWTLRIDDEGFCWDHWSSSTNQFIYNSSLDVLVLPLPCVIMVICYAMCSHALRAGISRLTNDNAIRDRLIRNKKVTNMFIIVVVTYFVLSAPYIIFHFVDNYLQVYEAKFHARYTNKFMMLNYGLFTLSALNSCVNPLIYTKMHHEVSMTIKSRWRRLSSSLRRSSSGRLILRRTSSNISNQSAKVPRDSWEQGMNVSDRTVLLRKGRRESAGHNSPKKSSSDHGYPISGTVLLRNQMNGHTKKHYEPQRKSGYFDPSICGYPPLDHHNRGYPSLDHHNLTSIPEISCNMNTMREVNLTLTSIKEISELVERCKETHL